MLHKQKWSKFVSKLYLFSALNYYWLSHLKQSASGFLLDGYKPITIFINERWHTLPFCLRSESKPISILQFGERSYIHMFLFLLFCAWNSTSRKCQTSQIELLMQQNQFCSEVLAKSASNIFLSTFIYSFHILNRPEQGLSVMSFHFFWWWLSK